MLFLAIRYGIWVSIVLLVLSDFIFSFFSSLISIKFCDFNARSTQCRSCHK